jgi:thiosulfate/3-mercaptopyruvate sulfurtransferase
VDYQFVDCRFDLAAPSRAIEGFQAGHIPGASFLDLDTDLSDMRDAPARGRHPLPTAETFAAAAGRAGIGRGVFVVAYDDAMTGGAARLWWLLRHFGHDDVAVLEGGLSAWRGRLEGGDTVVEPVEFELHERTDDTMTADEIHARLGDPGLAIVDARAPERFAGDPSGDPGANLDPVRGHIPGAVNVPFAGDRNFDEALLRAVDIVVYCGSGVTACVDVLALHAAGRPDARLYPGSWSEWSRRGLPTATGTD